MQPIPFATQSYMDPSRPVSVQRLVNMYLQPKSEQAKSRTALHGTPGLKLWSTVGDGPCRGVIGMNGSLYIVSGGELYIVQSNGSWEYINDISGSGPVAMATNGTHIIVTSNAEPSYAVNADSFQELEIPSFSDLTFQDGYILATERGTQRLFISSLDPGDGNPPSWDSLDFTLVNANPDLNVGIANLNRETWVFNERSAQVYYNSGAADFPFARNPSGVVERGCASKDSIATIQGAVLWLGDDSRVYANNGYVATPVSTPAIDYEIQQINGSNSAVAFVYSQRGHAHYVLTFPGKATFVYDLTTGLWHERQSWAREDWRARNHVFWFGKHLVGDALNGNIYELDHDTYTDNGDTIRRVMTSPPLHAGRNRTFMSRLEIDAEFGVGLEGDAQGSTPQAMLRWTDDGGRTYSNELWRGFGRSGRYKNRAVWTRLGSFRERSLELSISDPVKTVVIEAYADVAAGGVS
jgi:hypothetical protein